MKKIIKFLMLITLVIFGITTDFARPVDNRPIEEKMMDAVIVVDNSSGTIIYSEEDRAIILTAYHVISDYCEEDVCAFDPIEVFILRQFVIKGHYIELPELFTVINVDVNLNHDLALIEIATDRKLPSTPLAVDDPDINYGKPIFVAANPQRLYRSLKKGIVSNPLRMFDGSPSFEIDASVIFGSSGGGVLNEDGELIGVVRGIRTMSTPFCYDLWDDDGEHMGKECVHMPLPFLGFAVRPEMIRLFIQDSVFCEDLGYQCTEEVVAEDNTETTNEQEKVDE